MVCRGVEVCGVGVWGCGFVIGVGQGMCMVVCMWVWLVGVLWVVLGVCVVCVVVVVWLCGGVMCGVVYV